MNRNQEESGQKSPNFLLDLSSVEWTLRKFLAAALRADDEVTAGKKKGFSRSFHADDAQVGGIQFGFSDFGQTELFVQRFQ